MGQHETIYIVGNAKAGQNNPITLNYGQFFIAFVVHRETGEILECGASVMLDVTNRFIRQLFVGKSMETSPFEVQKELEARYFGSSQKAILTAFKDAQRKFNLYKQGEKVDLQGI
ncbi:conserved hypothetical protein [Thermosinus carboxydivorans Nor1]|uniref:DUF3870 domain-containing protein n=1 Tax=Thermosinus carboxydivorans Nor1 TaxID=401526 RepID=A1HLW2_9FIRM|nr:DUF3870 domain-containing protein [Thermosinus carboxydivorans]EAX48815.1 conserved hypothetical protein [Thermosinus carboxydivorans Nor1]